MKDFAADAKGATAIEYALIATLISIMIIASVTALGIQVGAMFTRVAAALR